MLIDGAGQTWKFIGQQYSDGVNWWIGINGNGQNYVGVMGELCPGDVAHGTIDPVFSFDRKIGGQDFWFSGLRYSVTGQSTSACGFALGYFVDVTKTTPSNTAQQNVDNASPNDTLHWIMNPTGIPYWQSAGTADITVAGLTINIDSGNLFANAEASQPPGHGYWNLHAANITLNGGILSGGVVRIENSASGVTIENGIIHDCINSGTSCILSGAGDATITITNETVYNGGDQFFVGQNHNVYLGANNATAESPANVQINGLVSYDVVGGGWTLKLRPLGIGTQNHITKSVIGCQHANGGNVAPACEQNGAIDMPCGGNYLIDHSTIERGPGGDNFYLVRAMEEHFDGAQCPANPASRTNNVTIDHDTFIWDGTIPYGGYVPVAVCVDPRTGPNCLSSNPYGVTCTITNSVLVGDSAAGATAVWGGGCTTDGTDRVYTNRAAAAAAEGWPGTDQFGNRCCAFPYLPPHP